MSLGGKFYVALASLLMVVFATLINAGPIADKPRVIDALQGLGKKLDDVTFRRTHSLGLTNAITIKELEDAKELYENCDLRLKVDIRQNWQLRLVVDLAVNPLNIIGGLLAEPLSFALFLIKLQSSYKRFRPAYAGEIIGEGQYNIKTVNSGKLFQLLKDPNSPIKMIDFERAKMEANNWRARHEEMTTVENIYAHLDELESILNYFNFIVFKPLYEHIYPDLDKYNDAQQVRQEYYKLLKNLYGVEFINGTPTYVRDGKYQVQKAGFTHVITA